MFQFVYWGMSKNDGCTFDVHLKLIKFLYIFYNGYFYQKTCFPFSQFSWRRKFRFILSEIKTNPRVEDLDISRFGKSKEKRKLHFFLRKWNGISSCRLRKRRRKRNSCLKFDFPLSNSDFQKCVRNDLGATRHHESTECKKKQI